MASLAVACLGSVRQPLGAAAMTVGDADAAIAHFEAAHRANVCLGHRPAQAIAAAELAAALVARGRAGDAERAAALWPGAIADAERFGMTGRVAAWRAAAATDVSATVCRRDGELWTIGFGGRAAIVPHSVGMEYLGELIANAGVEIPAFELASGHVVTGRSGGPQVVLDDAAKAAYRRRIDELRAEVDDADAANDLERAARARHELDVLLDELRGAVGLGGRSRRFAADPERARVSVRKAIMRAIAAVRATDPALGADLAARLVTGTRCVFAAAPPRRRHRPSPERPAAVRRARGRGRATPRRCRRGTPRPPRRTHRRASG